MRRRDDELAAAGAKLVFVGTGTPAMAASFAREHAGPHPVFSDAARRTFAAAGMRRSVWATLHWRMLANLWRALRAGFRQTNVQGDAWQQGGVLVLGPDGRERHRQVDRAGGDPIDLDAVVAAVRGVVPAPVHDDGRRSHERGFAAVPVLVAAITLLFAAPLLLFPADLFLRHWGGLPMPRIVVGVAAFVLVVGTGRRHPLRDLLASLVLVAVWSSCRVLTMGDGYWWRQAAVEGQITASSPGAGMLYHVVAVTFGAGAIEWIAPVFGGLATWAWLSVCGAFARADGDVAADRQRRGSIALLWAGSGIVGVFWYGFVEHSQIGVPFLILGLGVLAPRAADTVLAWRSLLGGTALLALAGFCHLQYVGLATVVLGVLGLSRLRRNGVRAWAVEAATQLLVFGAVFGAGALLGLAAGSSLAAGNVRGGADERLLTPLLAADGSWTGEGALLSRDHVTLVANVLLFVAPLALPWAVGTLVFARRRAVPHVWHAAGLAYLLFLGCNGFDFGWPVDADLLVSMSPALLLPVAAAVASGTLAPRSPVVQGSLLLAGAVATWCLAGPLVRPRWQNISQANGPAASLSVDGVGGDRQGPVEVGWENGRTVQLEVRGSPGDPFWVFRGLPVPASGGHPYGAVSDIAPLPEVAIHEALLCQGVLDANGRSVCECTVQPLADGSLPGIQALIGMRSRRQEQRASAAFYFVRERPRDAAGGYPAGQADATGR